jgi:hypothetical protein
LPQPTRYDENKAELGKEAKLKLRYIVAYRVEGLESPEAPVLLYSDDEQGKKVVLTGHTYEGLHHIATGHTIADMLLTGIFQEKTWNRNEFAGRVSMTEQDRIRRYGPNTAFLVVEASYAENPASIGQMVQPNNCEFYVAIANSSQDEVEKRHKLFLNQSQAFLAFTMPDINGFEEAGTCIMGNHPNGELLYVRTVSVGRPRLIVSNRISTGGPERYASFFRHATELDEFRTTFRLSVGSALNPQDNLRSFVFAFNALESFVKEFFKQNRKRLLKKENLSLRIKTYIEEIEKRREDERRIKDDFPLKYKFALIASFLALDKLDETMEEFDAAVQERNAIAHGFREFDEDALPIAKVRNWLYELVRLHVVRLESPI